MVTVIAAAPIFICNAFYVQSLFGQYPAIIPGENQNNNTEDSLRYGLAMLINVQQRALQIRAGVRK